MYESEQQKQMIKEAIAEQKQEDDVEEPIVIK
jgi:hypothetical protein